MAATAQSFGTLSRQQIVLDRNLPPVVPLGNRTVAVVVQPVQNVPASLQSELQASIENYLANSSSSPQVVTADPQVTVSATITGYESPTVATQVEKQLTRWTAQGGITVAVRVSAAAGKKILTSGNVSGNYYKQGDNSPVSLQGFHIHVGMPQPAPEKMEIDKAIIASAAQQIASYIVNTNEKVPVYLARGGAMDTADKYAEGKLWTRDLETLETMTPDADAKKEAYREYNIGVANEALGYAAPDPNAAMKYLQKASSDYEKALDAQPGEKFFLDPQQRIIAALKHYKDTGANTAEAAKAAEAAVKTEPSIAPASAKDAAPAAEPAADANTLTNADVAKMLQYHMDEANIIDNVVHAESVHFDLSIAGQMQLMKAGLTSRELTAMKKRAAGTAVAASGSTSGTTTASRGAHR